MAASLSGAGNPTGRAASEAAAAQMLRRSGLCSGAPAAAARDAATAANEAAGRAVAGECVQWLSSRARRGEAMSGRVGRGGAAFSLTLHCAGRRLDVGDVAFVRGPALRRPPILQGQPVIGAASCRVASGTAGIVPHEALPVSEAMRGAASGRKWPVMTIGRIIVPTAERRACCNRMPGRLRNWPVREGCFASVCVTVVLLLLLAMLAERRLSGRPTFRATAICLWGSVASGGWKQTTLQR